MTKARSNATAPAAKGQIVVGTGTDASGILSVGSNDQVLTADSSTATGLKWAAAGGALTLSQIASGSLTSGTELSLTSLSSYDTLMFSIYNMTWATGTSNLRFRINSSSSSVYDGSYLWVENIGGSIDTSFSRDTGADGIILNRNSQVSHNNGFNTLNILLTNCKSTGFTIFDYTLGFNATGGSPARSVNKGQGIFRSAAAVSSIQLQNANGYAFSAGNYNLWGG